MRILYVTAIPLESNSSASIGNNSLIKGLLSLGHTVEIATARYPQDGIGYDASLNENNNLETFSYDIGPYQKFYTRKSTPTPSPQKGRKRIFNTIFNLIKKELLLDSFVFWARKAKLFPKGKRYDLIISGSDPVSSHIFAYKLIKRNRVIYKKWIQVWGDPLYHDINRINSHFRYIFKQLEDKLLKKADNVFYVSENTLESQKQTYKKYAAKMHFAPRAWLHCIKSTQMDTISFGYFGDFLPNVRNINPLIQAFSSPALRDLPLMIVGKGNAETESSNVKIIGRLPYDQVISHEREVSVLIVICNLHGGQLPAKVYHYSGTDKPILIILDGNTESVKVKLQRYNRYIFCNNDAKDISNAVDAIVKRDYSIDLRPVEEFSPVNIARRILEDAGI